MTSESSSALDIEEIKTWSVNALRAFLHIRGKITDGTFDELVARVFVTSSENVDIDPELEHEERAVLSEYVSKLKLNETVLPDPLLLKLDWLGEKNRIIKWPSLIYKNIADYMSLLGPEFISQLEREYKLGKAYRYFAADFVREVYYHDISQESEYCFLRTIV